MPGLMTLMPHRKNKHLIIGVVFVLGLCLLIYRGASLRDGYMASNGSEMVQGNGRFQPFKSPIDTQPAVVKPEEVEETVDETKVAEIEDYSIFFKGLKGLIPTSPSLKDKYQSGGKAKELFVDNEFVFTKKYLSGVLDIPKETLKDLTKSHAEMVKKVVPQIIEKYHVETFGNLLKGNKEAWKTYSGSNGYVMIGGGKYNWLSFLGIQYMRNLGSKLPIEVFIGSEEDYEEDFCKNILPQYNAYCNVFPFDLMKSLSDDFKIGGYQYKLLALLISKFENVFYIDSDNIGVRNLDYLFESKVYQKHGLVFWPDAWARTTNPAYYDIANIKVGPKIRGDLSHGKLGIDTSNFHDFEGTIPNPTTETGMFMINKTSHLKTLLIALYYNAFGPNYYYPLFTQGSAGEGDKETFIAAALVAGESYYQVEKRFSWVGYHEDGSYHSKSLGHFDPVVDYQNFEEDKHYKEGDSSAKPKLVFMHLSYPKYTPYLLLEKEQELVNKEGNHRRLYGKLVEDGDGNDFELKLWKIFVGSLCAGYEGETPVPERLLGLRMKFYENDEKLAGYCDKYFLPRMKFLEETTQIKPES